MSMLLVTHSLLLLAVDKAPDGMVEAPFSLLEYNIV